MNSNGNTPLRILLGADTRVAAIDAALAAELGYSVAQLIDSPFAKLLDSADVEPFGRDLVALVTQDKSVASGKRTLLAADSTPLSSVVSAEARRTAQAGLVGFSLAVAVTPTPAVAPTLPEHLRNLHTPAALVDAQAMVLESNSAWQTMFEGSVDPAPLFGLVHEEEREDAQARFAELVSGSVGSIRTTHRCRAQDGSFWCRFSMIAVAARDRHFTVTAEDVSAEHLSRTVLAANEALFRSLAESSPVGLARVTGDLAISYSSPSWRRLTREMTDTPNLHMASVLHPQGRDEALDELRAAIVAGSDEPVRARLTDAGGETRWASMRIASVRDDDVGVVGHVITIEDITEVVQAQESQSQLAGIVESTSDLVGIADLRSGSIAYLNSAAQALFSPGGLRDGLEIPDLYPAEEIQRYADEIFPVLRRGETWSGEVTMIRHDGEHIRVIHTVAAEIGGTGAPERASVLGRDVTHERAALDELAYKATHDHLTGLPNRSLLLDRIELALARSERDRTPVAVLFVDLDRFKRVNDTYGHDAGDALLSKISERMSSVLRPSDTVARMGGDEFVVLCEDIDGENDALTIAGRVRGAIEDEPITINGVKMQVTASVGIAMSNGGSTRDPDTLLKRADAAMYRAKQSGRARTELFDEVLQDRSRKRRAMIDQLRRAIDQRELELHYQPIVDLTSGRVAGVEAFVRWMHPVSGLLGPRDFLQLASEAELDESLDALVIDMACADALGWHSELGADSPRVHVNVTGHTVRTGRLASAIAGCLSHSELPAFKLCVELTESVLIGDDPAVAEQLRRVRDLGVWLAVDDVGTGAMAIPKLARFGLQDFKIDGTLLADLSTSESTQQLVSGIVALGIALGLRVGAESLEDPAAIPWLKSMGVHVAQGHLFSKPLPAKDVRRLFALRSRLVNEPTVA